MSCNVFGFVRIVPESFVSVHTWLSFYVWTSALSGIAQAVCALQKNCCPGTVQSWWASCLLHLHGVVSYLVDPASSHMLVSKTKPCMCKYKRLNRETANGSLNQL